MINLFEVSVVPKQIFRETMLFIDSRMPARFTFLHQLALWTHSPSDISHLTHTKCPYTATWHSLTQSRVCGYIITPVYVLHLNLELLGNRVLPSFYVYHFNILILNVNQIDSIFVFKIILVPQLSRWSKSFIKSVFWRIVCSTNFLSLFHIFTDLVEILTIDSQSGVTWKFSRSL